MDRYVTVHIKYNEDPGNGLEYRDYPTISKRGFFVNFMRRLTYTDSPGEEPDHPHKLWAASDVRYYEDKLLFAMYREKDLEKALKRNRAYDELYQDRKKLLNRIDGTTLFEHIKNRPDRKQAEKFTISGFGIQSNFELVLTNKTPMGDFVRGVITITHEKTHPSDNFSNDELIRAIVQTAEHKANGEFLDYVFCGSPDDY